MLLSQTPPPVGKRTTHNLYPHQRLWRLALDAFGISTWPPPMSLPGAGLAPSNQKFCVRPSALQHFCDGVTLISACICMRDLASNRGFTGPIFAPQSP